MNKKRIRITDGGVALPLGNNTFLMKGRLHSQGGIGIGNGGKNDIEVEDGEVVKFNKDNIQVLSDQPMLNGISPANALLAGGNFNKIFKAQQSINGNYGGSYGKDGLIKRITNWLNGENNKETISLDGNVYNTQEEALNRDNELLNNEHIVEDVYNKHLVKKGDNLWNIARKNNTTVNELRKLNPNIKNDIIYPNQEIITSKIKGEKSILRNIDDIKKEEELYNKDNESAIKGYKHKSNYAIVDKAGKKITIYDKNNNVLFESNDISTGESGDDYNTITYKGLRKKGNMSTPAGITTITNIGEYHGVPSIQRKRNNDKDGNIASSIHYGNTSNAHNSNGCIRGSKEVMKALGTYLNVNDNIYTLPEKEGSKFVLRDGKLSFVADKPYGKTEGDNKYWDDYNTSIDKSYNELKIRAKNRQDDHLANINEITYIKAIQDNKEILQKEFNMDSNTYNKLAKLAMGIAQQESKFGSSDRYKLKHIIGDNTISLIKNITGDNSSNSRGITQIKMEDDNETMQKLYKKYNIDINNIKHDSRNSAIATMLRLAHMYNMEVKGRNLKGKDGIKLTDEEALLYKWMGKNKEIRNKTATPELNNYIQNVIKYSNNYEYYSRQKYKNGGQINMKLKHKNKQDITDIVMDEILPHSTGKRKKFVLGGSEWALIGNAGLNLLSGLGQGIAASINSSKIKKMYNNLKRQSTFIPVAREHINTKVDVEPQLNLTAQTEYNLRKNAEMNTSNSKVARSQARTAALDRIRQDNAIYSDKYNKENQLRNAEAELQTRYNLVDMENKLTDIREQNDFDMQKAIGKSNASTAAAQTWGNAIASTLGNTATSLMDYMTMKNDLLKSNNPQDYDEWFKSQYGHLFDKNGKLKVGVNKEGRIKWYNENKEMMDKFGWTLPS